MRAHNSHAVAAKIVSDYGRDITKLQSLKAQGKLNRTELLELERLVKAKQLVSRVLTCIKA